MDEQLYLIPNIDKAVFSIIKHDIPKIAASRVFACQRDMRARCERWAENEEEEEVESSGKAKGKGKVNGKTMVKKKPKRMPKQFMAGYPQTTHILSQMLDVQDDDLPGIDNEVDPDFAPKRAGFGKEVDQIEVDVPSNGGIAEVEERFHEAEAAFEKANRAQAPQAQAHLTSARERLEAARTKVCTDEFGVAEWGDGSAQDKVGGKTYGVVARIVQEGSPVYIAGVRRSMAAVAVDGVKVTTHAELMELFSGSSVGWLVGRSVGWLDGWPLGWFQTHTLTLPHSHTRAIQRAPWSRLHPSRSYPSASAPSSRALVARPVKRCRSPR